MKTKLEALKNWANEQSIENLDLAYFINEDVETFDDLRESIEEGGGFDVEIIYYSTAMEYLTENDASLRQSLEIASEFGFELDSLNSEALASLLASQIVREEFEELEDSFNELLEEL